MNLSEAPFGTPLRVVRVSLDAERAFVLAQLGVAAGENLEKVHAAPLGDPLTLRLGEQLFALRKDLCAAVEVETWK